MWVEQAARAFQILRRVHAERSVFDSGTGNVHAGLKGAELLQFLTSLQRAFR
jgi:hypothetical protein